MLDLAGQLPRLEKKELVFLQSISQYTFVVSALLYQW